MKKIALLTSFILSAGSVSAMEGVQIYGFSSYSGGMTTQEETLPDGSKSVFGTGGKETYNDQFSFRPETTYGLQIDADLEDGLFAKALIQADGEDEYNAEVKWSFMEYEFSPNMFVSLGRQPLPLFYYTDFIDVGYSYTWLRAPLEAYYIENSTFDGAQVFFTPTFGNWESKIQIYSGRDMDSENLRLNDMTGVVLYTQNDWLELRATVMKTKLVTKLVGFDMATGQITDLGDTETNAIYKGAAFKINFDSGFITAEWASDKEDEGVQEYDYLQGIEAWYASAGVIYKEFTPYVTYAESVWSASKENPFLLTDEQAKSSSWTIGNRWDFHSNAAFKVEYTRSIDDSDETLRLIQGEFKKVAAISAGVDLVF